MAAVRHLASQGGITPGALPRRRQDPGVRPAPEPAAGSAAEPGSHAFDAYESDPAHPVPYLDHVAVNMAPEYMVGDQRFAASRPDVLLYQTGPLERDVTLAGPIQAELVVSSTGTDADFIVKLIDVYPDDFPDPDPNPSEVRMGGFQQMVRGDVLRARFRDSLSEPAPLRPGIPTSLKFTLQDVLHTFRTGHRIMVQVQSSWFPLVDRNPQSFVPIAEAGSPISMPPPSASTDHPAGRRGWRYGFFPRPASRPSTALTDLI